jgi:hypothetical protein
MCLKLGDSMKYGFGRSQTLKKKIACKKENYQIRRSLSNLSMISFRWWSLWNLLKSAWVVVLFIFYFIFLLKKKSIAIVENEISTLFRSKPLKLYIHVLDVITFQDCLRLTYGQKGYG